LINTKCKISAAKNRNNTNQSIVGKREMKSIGLIDTRIKRIKLIYTDFDQWKSVKSV